MKHLEHKLIAIGSSTGGPSLIQMIVESLDSNFLGSIVVAQHMGSEYMKSFTKRLNEHSSLDVVLVRDGLKIEKSKVYICTDLTTVDSGGCFITKKSDKARYNPDIDQLFFSLSHVVDKFDILAVILSGIGEDGARGMFELYQKKVRCIAQSQESAVIFGMPRKAIELCQDIEVKDIKEIVDDIKFF